MPARTTSHVLAPEAPRIVFLYVEYEQYEEILARGDERCDARAQVEKVVKRIKNTQLLRKTNPTKRNGPGNRGTTIEGLPRC